MIQFSVAISSKHIALPEHKGTCVSHAPRQQHALGLDRHRRGGRGGGSLDQPAPTHCTECCDIGRRGQGTEQVSSWVPAVGRYMVSLVKQTEDNEISRESSMHWAVRTDYWGDLDIDGRVMLLWILKHKVWEFGLDFSCCSSGPVLWFCE